MINEDNGQISLEYMLIFVISLILLITFTLPLIQSEVEYSMDVLDVLSVKSDLNKISSAISEVYSEGQGAKQSVIIHLDRAVTLNIDKNHLSCNLKLNDASSKVISTNHKSNLEFSSISLEEGKNIIIVEWPCGNEKMIVH